MKTVIPESSGISDFWSNQDLSKNNRTRLSPKANLLAGGFGGLCSLVVGFPFDTVKVRLQTKSPPFYKSAWDCFRSIVINEGPLTLFRGISGLAVVALPKFALMFYTNAVVRNCLIDSQAQGNNYGAIFVSGAMSQILVVPFIVAPLERIKVIMQIDGTVKGQFACIKHIVHTEGFKGIFKGTLITFARDVPSFGTYFLLYDYLRQKFKQFGLLGTVASGSLAGLAGWTIAIPLDVIKSRHQSDPGSKSAVANAAQLYKLRGVRGFFLGAGPILLRAGPANAAAFLGYEFAIKIISYFSIAL